MGKWHIYGKMSSRDLERKVIDRWLLSWIFWWELDKWKLDNTTCLAKQRSPRAGEGILNRTDAGKRYDDGLWTVRSLNSILGYFWEHENQQGRNWNRKINDSNITLGFTTVVECLTSIWPISVLCESQLHLYSWTHTQCTIMCKDIHMHTQIKKIYKKTTFPLFNVFFPFLLFSSPTSRCGNCPKFWSMSSAKENTKTC